MEVKIFPLFRGSFRFRAGLWPLDSSSEVPCCTPHGFKDIVCNSLIPVLVNRMVYELETEGEFMPSLPFFAPMEAKQSYTSSLITWK